MRYLLSILLLFAGFFSSISVVYAKDAELKDIKLPKFEVLEKMKVAWAAEKISYNGLPASILNFNSQDSVEDLLVDYERAWRKKGFNQVARSKLMGMDVLGIKDSDGFYYTVQARPSGSGSEGSLIVSLAPLEATPEVKTEFPLYPQSKLLSVVESYDHGITAETIISTNSSSTNSNIHWLIGRLKRDGWVQQIFDLGVPQNTDSMQVYFQKDRQQCQITIAPNKTDYDGRTVVIVNWMK